MICSLRRSTAGRHVIQLSTAKRSLPCRSTMSIVVSFLRDACPYAHATTQNSTRLCRRVRYPGESRNAHALVESSTPCHVFPTAHAPVPCTYPKRHASCKQPMHLGEIPNPQCLREIRSIEDRSPSLLSGLTSIMQILRNTHNVLHMLERQVLAAPSSH
jgi:hypothetical protein